MFSIYAWAERRRVRHAARQWLRAHPRVYERVRLVRMWNEEQTRTRARQRALARAMVERDNI